MPGFKPLKNMRVVTLALNVPGPLAAKRLVEYGATVIKVEPPQGDPLEVYCADWYQEINRGQQRQQLDLKKPEGKAQLAELLASADLLLTAQRPLALERLGLSWAELQDAYPQLNHLAIVGYLAPHENKAGHDLTYQAALGLLNPPDMPKTLMADLVGAERAATEGLALLMVKQAGQSGQQKLIALSESADYMAQPLKHGLTAETGLLAGALPQYAQYETQSGWIAVAALEPHFSARLKDELELETLSKKALETVFKQRSADEWAAWANERDIPIVPIN
jgi:crotonobetainyl-CoA:carnitine CoA-transferase CaiB-like acyl-CoA transferase